VTQRFTAPVRASYTFTQSEFLNTFQSGDPTWGRVTAGDHFPYVPLHQASASAGLEHRRFGAYLAMTFVDSMREIAGTGEPPPGKKTDAYLLFDLSANYKVFPWLQVYANARNLTDQAYIAAHQPYGARPGAPRWVTVGLRAELH
jgi:Fe(3+) dicitrate transport protein